MKRVAAFLLVLLLATASHAGLKDRLEPIVTSGDTRIAVDRFIIGTEDAYVATLVRTIGPTEIADMRFTMHEMLSKYDRSSLILIEKHLFDKNAKKMALLERNLALDDSPETILASEPMANADLLPISADSLNERIWDGVAGPGGWGTRILSDDPQPFLLSADKSMQDTGRFAPVVKNRIGGIFLDKESLARTKEGVTARTVEAFNYDAEVHYGGRVFQYTGLPYQDAYYAITTSEYSFARRAFRQLRFTVFGLDQKILYSVKIANPVWVDDEMDPFALTLLHVIGLHLPEYLAGELSGDVKTFNGYAEEKFRTWKEALDTEQSLQRQGGTGERGKGKEEPPQ